MKHLLYLVLFLPMVIGCGSSTEPTNTSKLGSTFIVHDTARFAFPYFDGGGRWFAGNDTGVWYDMTFAYTFQNITSSLHFITYKLEVGAYKNGKFQRGNGELFFDGDSIFVSDTAIPVWSYEATAITKTVGVGRRNNDWSYSYGYRITFFDEKNDSLVVDGSFDDIGDNSRKNQGSSPLNRFHGVVITTEKSPDSLGILDGPDDGDWNPLHNSLTMENAFPNPLSKNITLLWTLPKRGELSFAINKTRRDTLYSAAVGFLDVGEWKYELSMDSVTPKGIKPGMYRVYVTAMIDGQQTSCKGDIMVTK